VLGLAYDGGLCGPTGAKVRFGPVLKVYFSLVLELAYDGGLCGVQHLAKSPFSIISFFSISLYSSSE
jgi:hypothetical protein